MFQCTFSQVEAPSPRETATREREKCFPHGQLQAPYPCHVQAGAQVDNLHTWTYWLRYPISFHVKAGDFPTWPIASPISLPRVSWGMGWQFAYPNLLIAIPHILPREGWGFVHLKQLFLATIKEIMAEMAAPCLLRLTQTRGCRKRTCRFLTAHTINSERTNKLVYPKLFPNFLVGFPGDFPRPVGNANTQILATCRLENQNPKSLLHAGWKIKTPNPWYM